MQRFSHYWHVLYSFRFRDQQLVQQFRDPMIEKLRVVVGMKTLDQERKLVQHGL